VIDRRDLLASLIKWTIPSPINFVLKQLNCKPYLKGFVMTGERDGAKSELTREMIKMHGNKTNEQDAESINSVSIGSANTEAKLGQAVSKTTNMVEISEISTVESYGRSENLVQPYKTSVDTLVVRRGKNGSRTDAPFPNLSPLIINGNPPFSFKGELLKRFHVAKFNEEDRHDRDPNSAFNKFQRDNEGTLKILGDWTMRYILDNKQELLLSKKFNAYQIGEKALQAFYESVGEEDPEWLTWWIVDKLLDELDMDVTEVIRYILYNQVNKSLRDNPNLLPNEGHDLTLDMRIQKCIDGEVWPGLRRLV
jgi:hypothetical protein